jgi:hypothetical protein
MRRNSFGFPDVTNDRIADNTAAITPATLATYESSIAPNTLNRDASVHGDELIDRLTANFEPGDPSLIVGVCSGYFRGYTYTLNAPPCSTAADMASRGIDLDILQLCRTIANSGASDFDLNVLDAVLYIDEACTNCQQCANCGEFDYVNAQLPNGQDDWSTKIIMTIPGAYLNTANNVFLERNGDEFMFSFHENNIHTPPTGQGIVINDVNGGNHSTFNYTEAQQYRLIVRYSVCGNKYSTSLYYPTTPQLKFITDVTNKMWLTGGSTGGLFPNGFDLSNTNPNDESFHDQMPNIVYHPTNTGYPDMQNVNWALAPNPPYCTACNEIDQSFADNFKFYCETCGGTHTFYSTDITTSAAYTTGAYPSASSTYEKAIAITGVNSFARSKFGNGVIPKDLFPYEYRPPALFPQTWTLDLPPGYTLSTTSPPVVWSNFYKPNPTWLSVANFKTADQAFNPQLTMTGSQVIINPTKLATNLSTLNCITRSIPANNSSPNLLIGDNVSSQTIKLWFKPDCTVPPGLQYFEVPNPGTITPIYHGDILFGNNTTGCHTAATCGNTQLQHNMNGPNTWTQPFPHLEAYFAPTNADAFTPSVCWPFTITNLPATPPLPTDPAYTEAYNVFVAAPVGLPYSNYLTSWYADYSYNGNNYTNVAANAGGIIGLLPAGTNLNLPNNQNSIITGQVCATYTPCQGTVQNNYVTSLPLKAGWNCNGIPTNLAATCNQNILTSTVTLTDLPVNIIPSVQQAPTTITICTGTTYTIKAKFTNSDYGQTHPTTINLTGANINVSNVWIYNCNTGVQSAPLAGSGLNYSIGNNDLASIGYSAPDYMMTLNSCIGVKVDFTANCPSNAAGMQMQLPNIGLGSTSYCGQTINTTANFLTATITASSCSNCFGITKTIAPQPAIAGEPVTYTINVCSYNAGGGTTVSVNDVLPPATNFIAAPPVTFPQNVTLTTGLDCTPLNVTGIFTNLNSTCPDVDFTNTATLVSTGQTASVCAIVTCPTVISGQPHATISDHLASQVFGSFPNPLTGATIFVDDYVQLTMDQTITFDNCTFVMGAGSSIFVNSGIILNINNNTLLYSCPQMWMGIVLDNTAKIEMKRSTLKDAETGIDAGSQGNFKILDSHILDCIVGLQAADNTTGTVGGTEFGKVNIALKGAYNGQAPYGKLGRAGILLNDMPGITIGDNSLDENVFHDLNFGVEMHNSNTNVQNCRFDKISADNAYTLAPYSLPKPMGAGITARRENDFMYFLRVSPLVTGATTITNTTVGVYTNFYNARINGISMTDVERGIKSEDTHARCSVTVMDCDINATFRGIDWINNDGSSVMGAYGNSVVVNPPVNGALKGPACISIAETNQANQAHYSIYGNTNIRCQSANSGIVTSMVNNADIEFNWIYTESGQAVAPGSTGININGGDGNTINCNNVTNTIASNNVTRRLFVSQSKNNRITCNNFYSNGTGRGMNIAGMFSTGTQMRGNQTSNDFVGLWLESSAVMGQQPPAGTPPYYGNRWTGTFTSGFGAVNMNTSANGMVDNRVTVRDPANGGAADNLPATPTTQTVWPDNTGWFDKQPSGTTFDCNPPPPKLSFCGGSALTGDDDDDDVKLKIAQNYTLTAEYINESKAMAKQYLYEELNKDNVLLNSNSLYQTFEAAHANDAIGKLYLTKINLEQIGEMSTANATAYQTVYEIIKGLTDSIHYTDSLDEANTTHSYAGQRLVLVNQLNLEQQALEAIIQQQNTTDATKRADAATSNTGVSSSELPLVNEKYINSKVLQYYTSGKSAISNDYNALLQIAQQCPSAGGPAVYTARVMLSLITDEIDYNDDNACLQAGYYRMAQAQLNNVISDIVIVPNPANETVKFIAQNNLKGVCKIRLINAIGKLVFENTFNCSDKEYTVDVSHFAQGIYQAEIEAAGTEKKNAKLVIVH